MDLMENLSFKTKYHKYKIRVKLWESEFMEKYGRKPNKNDIKAADFTIREAYKIYWNLKTKALDESLTEITFWKEKEENSLENDSISELLVQSSNDKCETQNNNIKALTSNETFLKSESFSVEIPTNISNNEINVKGAWGQHLNSSSNTLKTNQTILMDKSFQLSQKMFRPQSFLKRNPRKNSCLKSTNNSKKNQDIYYNHSSENQADINSLNFSTFLDSSLNKNFKIVYEQQKLLPRPKNTKQQLIEKCVKTTFNKSLNQAWLNRCFEDIDTNIEDNQYLKSNSDFSSTDYNCSSKKNLATQNLIREKSFSDDDYISNSDIEEERKNKRIRNFNKISIGTEVQLHKKPCLVSRNSNSEEIKIYPDAETSKLSMNTANFQNINKKSIKEESSLLDNDINNVNVHIRDKDHVNDDDLNSTLIKEKPIITRKHKNASNLKEKNLEIKFNESKNQIKVDVKNYLNEISELSDSAEFSDIVPRLPLNITATGNLITDCSTAIEPSNLQLNSINSTSFSPHISSKENFEHSKVVTKFNENFVRINLKKKVFVRGKKSFNLSKYKKKQWKQKRNDLSSSKRSLDIADYIEKNQDQSCSKCGRKGHLAKKCLNFTHDDLLTLAENTNISSYPTLEEVEKTNDLSKIESLSNKNAAHNSSIDSDTEQINFLIQKDCTEENNTTTSDHDKITDNVRNLIPSGQEIHPVYELNEDGSIKDTPLEVMVALRKFNHKEFRVGQERAIMRILSGQSTLVTLATGSGKSLCYQLPAYIYTQRVPCIVLVISPLVSLMDDQVSGIPDFLKAACLHGNQSPALRKKVLEKLKAGKLNILFVSPETIVAGEGSVNFKNIFHEFPPIAFACIDEAHCISQWSHNFRPSYLMICRVLKEKLGVNTILGLTATASKFTTISIVNLIDIKDGTAGVISETPLPSNLNLTISRDEQKEKALISLLCSKRFSKCKSIIIYCTRREECIRISSLIRTSLNQDITSPHSNKKISSIAEAYHAGLSPYRRKLIQTAFMKSEIRIMVATVAFGMGINKSDIRAVIHFNMPSNVENYVQEIGRAGRDGLPAHGHLFLNFKKNSDEYELCRHINANKIDRHTIRRLLQKIFIPCHCINAPKSNYCQNSRCSGHEVAFSIDDTVKALDISEEMITTLLCYLELHSKRFIKVLPPAYTRAKISSYVGPNALKLAAQSSPPLAMALAVLKKQGNYYENSSNIEFPVIEIAAMIGWDSGLVKSHLKSLEWKSVNEKKVRSAVCVKFDTLGFRVKAPGDLTAEELDNALESLIQLNESQGELRLQQLRYISTITRKFCFETVEECFDLTQEVYFKSEEFKKTISAYFNMDNPLSIVEQLPEINLENELQIIADIRSLISSYKDCNFTGRSIARIFHGIQSPNYPAYIWYKCRFWRAHITDDFNALCNLATKEILNLK